MKPRITYRRTTGSGWGLALAFASGLCSACEAEQRAVCAPDANTCVVYEGPAHEARARKQRCLLEEQTLLLACGREGLVGICVYRDDEGVRSEYAYAEAEAAERACGEKSGTWQSQDPDPDG